MFIGHLADLVYQIGTYVVIHINTFTTSVTQQEASKYIDVFLRI